MNAVTLRINGPLADLLRCLAAARRAVAPPLRLVWVPIADRWARFFERTINPMAPEDIVRKHVLRRAKIERMKR